MKKVCLFIVFVFSFLTIITAENDRISRTALSFEEYAKTLTNWMILELDLSSDQIEEVDAINLRFVKAEQVLIDTMSAEEVLLENAMKALEQKKTSALSFVLTPRQMKDYKKILQKENE